MKKEISNIIYEKLWVIVLLTALVLFTSCGAENESSISDKTASQLIFVVSDDSVQTTECEECIEKVLNKEEMLCLTLVNWAESMAKVTRDTMILNKMIRSRMNDNGLGEKNVAQVKELAYKASIKTLSCYPKVMDALKEQGITIKNGDLVDSEGNVLRRRKKEMN